MRRILIALLALVLLLAPGVSHPQSASPPPKPTSGPAQPTPVVEPRAPAIYLPALTVPRQEPRP